MTPSDLDPAALAQQLHQTYLADHGLGGAGLNGYGLGAPERTALADYLGCHPDARRAAWAAWQETLLTADIHLDDAEYWLDAEFVHPCPEDEGLGSGDPGDAGRA